LETSIDSLREEIIEVGKRIYARGYVASNDGNISARINDDKVLITSTGISKGFMKPEDLIIIDMDGKLIDGNKKPSSEVFMHVQIFKERPDIKSVCHAHPPYATGFAVAGIPLDKYVLPEVVITLGTIPLVEYGTTGTEEFYKPLLPLLKDFDAFLLANHGALTIGKDIFNAYYKMETLEHFAHIAFIAHQLGNVNTLNKDQVQKLFSLREKFGIRKNIGLIPEKEKRTRKTNH
jgi:L-fuculose-phosphate aldolase